MVTFSNIAIMNLRHTALSKWQKVGREKKSLWIMVEKESEKTSLKLNIIKLRSCHPVPSLHGK